MFVSFDSDGAEVVRNLTSVGIRLGRYVKSGVLRMVSARTITGSAESLLVRIKAMVSSMTKLERKRPELFANYLTEQLDLLDLIVRGHCKPLDRLRLDAVNLRLDLCDFLQRLR